MFVKLNGFLTSWHYLACVRSLGRSLLFRGSQEPERTPARGSSEKRFRFSEEPPQVFPSPELEPDHGHRDDDGDLCPGGPPPLERHAIVKSPLEEALGLPPILLEPRKLEMPAKEARANSGGCVPWKKLFTRRRRKEGGAEERQRPSSRPEKRRKPEEGCGQLGCATEERRREHTATGSGTRRFNIAKLTCTTRAILARCCSQWLKQEQCISNECFVCINSRPECCVDILLSHCTSNRFFCLLHFFGKLF